MKTEHAKFIMIAVILLAGVLTDQISKLWAEANLASPRYEDSALVLEVDAAADAMALEEFLVLKLEGTRAEDVEVIARRFSQRDGMMLGPKSTLRAGDEVTIGLRPITVIDGYWDYMYARNPGAAWSFLATADEGFRRWFFFLTSFIAICLIGYFLVHAEWQQKRLIIALSLVLSGAIGNLIDRINYGYVIDFIAWHVGETYWPTFNLADAYISIGVGLMAIELLLGHRAAKASAAGAKDEVAEAGDAAENREH